MRRFLLLTVLLFSALLIATPISFAHNAGYSFEQKIGKYKVDIGYDTKPIEDNAPVTFDFNIKDIQTDEYLDFGDAWVRIESGNATYFATGVFRQELGATTLVYTFSKPGKYNMYVRFENKDQQLVETTIPIEVNPNSDQGATNPLFQFKSTFIGVFVGFAFAIILTVIVFMLKNKSKKSSHTTNKDE